MRLSKRLDRLPQADIRAMTLECQKIGGFNLSQGVCDLPTPKPILEAASRSVLADQSVYAPALGVDELREKISAKVRNENQIECDKENVVVSSGVTGAFAAILTGLCDPGDGIVLFEPFYGYHYNQILLTLCEPQVASLDQQFRIDIDSLEQAIQPNTRAIVLNTPANPCGRMLSAQEIEQVLEVAKKHQLFVISDEIYEYFKYDGREHISPASLDQTNETVVSMMGLSKSYSITGWRLAYTVAPQWALPGISKATDLFYVCAPTPLQMGALAAFDLPQSYYDGLIETFSKKRNQFCQVLEDCGLNPVVPEGSYYVLADVTRLKCKNSIEASGHLLREGKVASVPGQAFFTGTRKDQYVRFCFAVDDKILDGACEALMKLK